MLCDLLWSDPEADISGWAENDRGVSYTFGADVVSKFLQKHDYDLIVRAHQVVEDGYEFFADRQLVTLFSAPNYCGEFDNAGAVMAIDESLMCSFRILKPAEKGKFGFGGPAPGPGGPFVAPAHSTSQEVSLRGTRIERAPARASAAVGECAEPALRHARSCRRSQRSAVMAGTPLVVWVVRPGARGALSPSPSRVPSELAGSAG